MKPKLHPRAEPRKPLGVATRGKTASNRLRRVDTFLLRYDRPLLMRSDGAFHRAFFVDLGYGRLPITTLESAARLHQANPDLPILGVEIDPERVAAAQPFATDKIQFRLGGFNLPLGTWPDGTMGTVRAIRAFNVLRQYDESDVGDAYARMSRYVLPGGLLLEGTSDPPGRIWAANVVRRIALQENTTGGQPWRFEALVFSTNFRGTFHHGFDPTLFQPILPKNLIHRVVPGEPIYAFFEAWKAATAETAPFRIWGLRMWFMAAALRLRARGYAVNTRPGWLRRGFLIVRGL